MAEATGTAPISWSVDSAPDGFSIDTGSGLVQWTPTEPGSFDVTIRASNLVGNDTQTFTVVVLEPPLITSTPTLSADPGLPYHYDGDDTAEASGSTPISWSSAAVNAEGTPEVRQDSPGEVDQGV